MSSKKNKQNFLYEKEKNKFSFSCGVVIKRLRVKEGLTGAELAKKLNISQQQISRYERGINKVSIDLLFNISIILKIPFEQLIKKIVSEVAKSNSDNVEILTNCVSDSGNIHFF